MSDKPGYIVDAESSVVSEHWAVVYAPRRHRNRFPANCVHLCDSDAAALAQADSAKSLYPARLVGPSKSSEGFMMFYLVRWLD